MSRLEMNLLKKKMTKVRATKILLVSLSLIIGLGTALFIGLNSGERKYDKLREKIYTSMNDKTTRLKAYNRAVALNNGATSNTCVYFLSEVLRINGFKIDDKVCNTFELLDVMKKDKWKKEKDYKKLKKGDICFTTDEKLDKDGIPTHVYIFMGWKEEGKYDYAYICDNQAKDYAGKIYHLRNITNVATEKGNAKEPFSFFMYK